jgi:thioredoxin-related protein
MNKIIVKPSVLFIAYFSSLILFNNGFSQSNTFEDALKAAKEQDKKVIVDVYTDWCGWCKKMDRDAYGNSEIKEIIEDDFIFVKLNAEGSDIINYQGKQYTCSELATYFQVSGYPTTIFLTSDGNVIEYLYDKFKMNNLPGYYNASDFKKMLHYIKNEKYRDTDLSTIL